jgi:hypothetical protein
MAVLAGAAASVPESAAAVVSDSREDGELDPIEPSQPSSSAAASSVDVVVVSAAGVEESADGPPTSPMAVVGAVVSAAVVSAGELSLDEESSDSLEDESDSVVLSEVASCDEGELEPIEPSQPLSSDPESESDASLAADDEGAASAASVGDEIDPPSLDSAVDDDEVEVEVDPPPLSLDSCEDGELEPTEPSQPPPESVSADELLLDGAPPSQPPGSARVVAGMAVPAVRAAARSAANMRHRLCCSRNNCN